MEAIAIVSRAVKVTVQLSGETPMRMAIVDGFMD